MKGKQESTRKEVHIRMNHQAKQVLAGKNN